MKKTITTIIGTVLLVSLLHNQEIQHEATVVNIEVPVRIFKNDRFIENLTKEDFEVYEDGKLQKIEAVYLVKNTAIERREEKKPLNPETSRHFYFFFEITDCPPKMENALRYFFHNTLMPEDNLTIITPRKSYALKAESLKRQPKEKIIKDLSSILRRDAWIGSSEYRSIIKDLKILIRNITIEDLEEFNLLHDYTLGEQDNTGKDKYVMLREKLETLRRVDQKRLLSFAEYLRSKKGQKHVFIFYQKEFVPQFTSKMYHLIMSKQQDHQEQFRTLDLHGYFFRDISFDTEKVKQAYSDSSITINFLFFTKPAEHIPGIDMVEHSEDFFGAFNEMSQSTGGITVSSANPEFLFTKASEAAENYYLIYYSTANYKADGKFRNINVRVKGDGYRVFHRAGYFAN